MSDSETPAPLAQQITAFLTAVVLSKVAMTVFEAGATSAIVQTRDDIGNAMTVVPFLAHLVGLVVWIVVYTMFASVPVKKVIPWLWAIGGIHVAISIMLTANSLARFNLQPPIGYYVSVTAGMIALILLFQAWFVKKGRIPPKE